MAHRSWCHLQQLAVLLLGLLMRLLLGLSLDSAFWQLELHAEVVAAKAVIVADCLLTQAPHR
jgi:hypothetical protein